ncbi:hypothetical protein ACFX13_018936 [Malus domestica]
MRLGKQLSNLHPQTGVVSKKPVSLHPPKRRHFSLSHSPSYLISNSLSLAPKSSFTVSSDSNSPSTGKFTRRRLRRIATDLIELSHRSAR